MIRAICFTNLDGYSSEVWPDEFVAVPRPGEWVQAKSGKVLTVVKVTHGMKPLDGKPRPHLRVELHR
jgi:hypothetical protein